MLDWLPQNVSIYGGDIDYFFYVIYYITTVVFFLVAGAMIYFLIRFRFKEGRRAEYSHGNTTLEIVWTSATLIAMIVLALATLKLQDHPRRLDRRLEHELCQFQDCAAEARERCYC